jgi:thiamine-phosphate diphosphorylase
MTEAPRRFDPAVLQLVLVTDGRGDAVRLETIVAAAVGGGVRCVQLREPHWSARTLLQVAERLRPMLDAVGGLLLVNDRVDVAASGACHGAQIGHRSLPPELARQVLGPSRVLAYSAHDQGQLDLAAASGCDFALLAPVWSTSSKPGAEHLGEGLAVSLTTRARLPVVWLGGITPTNAARIADLPVRSRPAGIAVRSAVMEAEDPRYAVAALLRALLGAPAAPRERGDGK